MGVKKIRALTGKCNMNMCHSVGTSVTLDTPWAQPPVAAAWGKNSCMNSGRDDSKSCGPKARPTSCKSCRMPVYHHLYSTATPEKIKKKLHCYLQTPKCPPSKTLFSACMQRALFFCFCLVSLHSTPHGGWNTLYSSTTRSTTQRGGGCVVTQGPKVEAPDMSSRSQEGQTKWNQKNAKKSESKNVCARCEHIAIGTRYLYGQSALSGSNVNVPHHPAGSGRSAPPTSTSFSFSERAVCKVDLVHLHYSNPSGILPH
ncbi:hypothetical protein DFH94DRAFT_731930 [Russula ochroleuca]|uniref:Uncharacterized protein n=1 Tax=Russula ochroleuca TaxID=152965 RepID=A0A9P5MY24_9AGAM|nr:hypothetical protein DFH94DRAFT_731930 [Russula ochroleuca]